MLACIMVTTSINPIVYYVGQNAICYRLDGGLQTTFALERSSPMAARVYDLLGVGDRERGRLGSMRRYSDLQNGPNV